MNRDPRERETQLTEEQQRREEQRANDLRIVMSTPEGRRFVWDQLAECGTFHSGWSPSAEIHLRAGMRQIGLALFARVHRDCFNEYQAMEREARDKAERERLERETNNNEES